MNLGVSVQTIEKLLDKWESTDNIKLDEDGMNIFRTNKYHLFQQYDLIVLYEKTLLRTSLSLIVVLIFRCLKTRM